MDYTLGCDLTGKFFVQHNSNPRKSSVVNLTFADLMNFKKGGIFKVDVADKFNCNFCGRGMNNLKPGEILHLSEVRLLTYSCIFDKFYPRKGKCLYNVCDGCISANQANYVYYDNDHKRLRFVMKMMEDDFKLSILNYYNHINYLKETIKGLKSINNIDNIDDTAARIKSYNDGVLPELRVKNIDGIIELTSADLDKVTAEFNLFLPKVHVAVKYEVVEHLKKYFKGEVKAESPADFLLIKYKDEIGKITYQKPEKKDDVYMSLFHNQFMSCDAFNDMRRINTDNVLSKSESIGSNISLTFGSPQPGEIEKVSISPDVIMKSGKEEADLSLLNY